MLYKFLIKKTIMMVLIAWSFLILIYIVTRYYQLQINVSTSMPQRLWLTHVGDKLLRRGDYVVIVFHDFRMKNHDDFEYVVKQVGGVGDDQIIIRNYPKDVSQQNKINLIYSVQNDLFPVFDKISGNHFNPLTNKSMAIPKGCYFIHGQHQPSFDSRYREFGLICNNQIYGKAYPIF